MPELKLLRNFLLTMLFAGTVFSLSGCIAKTVDELYALPRHSDAYYELQNAIDSVMTDGVQYAAPISGTNQQSVQLVDLDADGEDEAVVFLRKSGEQPLCAYVFDRVEDRYQCLGAIEGSGTAFESVEYVQLDDTPELELILGRQLNGQVLRSLSAYSLKEGTLVEILSENYSEYALADLNGNGKTDILLLRFDAESRTGTAELYSWESTQLSCTGRAPLSTGAVSVKHILTGALQRGIPAAFVTSLYDSDSIVTDVFAFRGDSFENITASSGTNGQTVHNYSVYAADIDADGIIELPRPITLAAGDDSGETNTIISWNTLSLDGRLTPKMTTYHSFSGGWFWEIPDDWSDSLTILRTEDGSGTRGIVFAQWNAKKEQATPIVTVYAFSGEDRAFLANEDGRILLAEKGGVTYAAVPGSSPLSTGLTQDVLRNLFHFIHIDWNSGER